MLLLCFCILSGRAFTQVAVHRIDSLSYENYLQMLDEESKIPLSDIRDEENPEHLKERAALYGNDRAAYTFQREGILQANEFVSKFAVNMAKNAGLQQAQANALEGVYRYFNDIKLRMIDEIGPKKFAARYVAATPRFAHVEILKEAKIREVLSPDDHFRYFMKNILPAISSVPRQVIGKDDFKGVHYVRMPLFSRGRIVDWISRNVKYPMEALQNNWQGKVFVNFNVEANGSVSDVKVLKSNGIPCLNQEAVRVVKTFPKFIPGWCPIRQRNIEIRMTVPISFQLTNGSCDVMREQVQMMDDMNRMRSAGGRN